MSEQLPDVYILKSSIRPDMKNRDCVVEAYTTSAGGRVEEVVYTPHSKLQEAEDVIDDLICDERACLSCGMPLYKDDRWHEGNHKLNCVLAPYMRKRSTTNE